MGLNITAPQLLAKANGIECVGEERCFWCGAPASEDYAPPSGFVGWGEVVSPASRHICAGCRIATNESDRSRRPRMWSWLITEAGADGRAKGEIDTIRGWCLAPPVPPFAIVIATSGQKNLIYRAPINQSADVITVQFELEHVTYRPADLVTRLDLAKRVCAASGKPALVESPSAKLAAQIANYYEDFEPIVNEWFNVWAQPLSRLAAFLCPRKEEAQHEHPSDIFKPAAAPANVRRRVVSAKAGGPDGPGLFGD